MKCNMIASVFYDPESKISFLAFVGSKLLNESHFSLHENVFPLIKRVKRLSQFSDFLLLAVLAIYLS